MARSLIWLVWPAPQAGDSPLHWAVSKSAVQCVAALLHGGAAVTLFNGNGDVPEDMLRRGPSGGGGGAADHCAQLLQSPTPPAVPSGEQPAVGTDGAPPDEERNGGVGGAVHFALPPVVPAGASKQQQQPTGRNVAPHVRDVIAALGCIVVDPKRPLSPFWQKPPKQKKAEKKQKVSYPHLSSFSARHSVPESSRKNARREKVETTRRISMIPACRLPQIGRSMLRQATANHAI